MIFFGFINNINLNEKIETLATKTELKADKIVKFQLFDSIYLRGKIH